MVCVCVGGGGGGCLCLSPYCPLHQTGDNHGCGVTDTDLGVCGYGGSRLTVFVTHTDTTGVCY